MSAAALQQSLSAAQATSRDISDLARELQDAVPGVAGSSSGFAFVSASPQTTPSSFKVPPDFRAGDSKAELFDTLAVLNDANRKLERALLGANPPLAAPAAAARGQPTPEIARALLARLSADEQDFVTCLDTFNTRFLDQLKVSCVLRGGCEDFCGRRLRLS